MQMACSSTTHGQGEAALRSVSNMHISPVSTVLLMAALARAAKNVSGCLKGTCRAVAQPTQCRIAHCDSSRDYAKLAPAHCAAAFTLQKHYQGRVATCGYQLLLLLLALPRHTARCHP
jgi:hypothetical protein